jgi:hypothetical protein
VKQFEQSSVQQGLATHDPEERATLLFALRDNSIHHLNIQLPCRLRLRHPAPLARQIAAIGNRKEHERGKEFSLLHSLLELLNCSHALESEIPYKLPQYAFVGLNQHTF